MKTLFLVRHAKSSWGDSYLTDAERPLNERGERDASRMGKQLSKKNIFADCLMSSPAIRAHSTAIKIAKEIGYSETEIQIEKRLYFEGIGKILDVINSLDPGFRTVLLFSHNPAITALAISLANAAIDSVPTCGIVEIQFQDSWKMISLGEGEFVSFDYPKRIGD